MNNLTNMSRWLSKTQIHQRILVLESQAWDFQYSILLNLEQSMLKICNVILVHYVVHTVLVIIKLTKFAVRCGFIAVPVLEILSLFHHDLRYLRTLYIVWSLVRRRATRRLNRLQTMCNILKYRKIL